METQKLSGKVALITGAGSGLGKASALLLAGQGTKIGALDASADAAQQTVQEIRQAGGDALALTADVSDAQALQAAVTQLVAAYRRLDIVFVNAGIDGMAAPIDELTPEEWHRTIHTNLTGGFLTLHVTVPHLKEARGGSIILTSSINGTRVFSNPGMTAYSCSKAGLLCLAQMAALELARHGIRVNAICPGATATQIKASLAQRDLESIQPPVEYPQGQIPLAPGQPGSAEEVAELVLFLASDAPRHITGTPVWIDGGQSLLMG